MRRAVLALTIVAGGAAPFACALAELNPPPPSSGSEAGPPLLADATTDSASRPDAGRADADAGAPPPPCATLVTDAAAPRSVGGTRLRPTHLVSPDGLDVPLGIRDTVLDFDCEPSVAIDGVLRCLPPEGQRIRFGYSDAACTQRIALADAGLSGMRVVSPLQETSTGCGRDAVSVTLGADLTGTPLYYQGVVACAPLANGTTAYAITSISGVDAFVGLAERRVQFTPNLDAVMLDGSEGSSHFVDTFFDRAHGARVRLPRTGQPGYCLPDGVRETDPIYTSLGNTGGDTRLCNTPGDFYRARACGPFSPGTTMFELGGRAFEVALRTMTVHECVTLEHRFIVTSVQTGFAVQREIPQCELEPSPLGYAGGTRLRTLMATVGGASLRAAPRQAGARDVTMGDTACYAEAAADGVSRCFPTPTAQVLYLDPACTQPVALVQGVAPAFARASSFQGAACDSEIRAVGNLIAAPADALYGREYGVPCGECRPTSRRGRPLHEVGPVLPPSTFAQLDIVVR